MAAHIVDIAGQRFGSRLILDQVGRYKGRQVLWGFVCDCGFEGVGRSNDIMSSRSCAHCKGTRHGDTRKGRGHNKRLYRIWANMKTRCSNPNVKSFADYGGRGVTICTEWLTDFIPFRDWALENGYADDLTIDRIDNDKGYSSDNCRWATRHEQRLNQRKRKSK